MKILFIGDIIGRPGRQAVEKLLPGLVEEHQIDFVIANGENAAAGFGLTPAVLDNLFALGIDVVTSGNHLWDKRDILPRLKKEPRLLRPANYPPDVPGTCFGVYQDKQGRKVGVFNLLGRVFMPAVDCPFRTADQVIAELKKETDIIILDMHAEATSEKIALGWYLDGRASAVIGTHTHVMTADERVLPQGTAYITDAGMTGGFDSVIGMEKEPIIEKFLTQLPTKFEVAEGDVRFNGVVVEVDEQSGKARGIIKIIYAEQ
ncbi:MAG: TIGR00282 family metallophosphoesterase [Candidatus Edwardsbacteria bacterium]|nr:TIGR00282 family metallophosphoesterase [Candidatus Edwardsbacteria bacterium]MBU1577384.1 TIGR00282 family metallophosphoesterase [Candidatus Edwardsbacteria bacterium]MBU2463940.1 TIGR00282 family metallophosphoesterase [Candidatus Edwardsbacteria bacterium]MBU2593506.1 TIGR00282 family metallophosphoesterase [Candidatus Edwardsbacteria bacterium]